MTRIRRRAVLPRCWLPACLATASMFACQQQPHVLPDVGRPDDGAPTEQRIDDSAADLVAERPALDLGADGPGLDLAVDSVLVDLADDLAIDSPGLDLGVDGPVDLGPDGPAFDQGGPATAWAISAGGPLGDSGSGVTVDSAGNIYVTGTFQGTASFGTTTLTSSQGGAFVAKLDSAGNWLWAVALDGLGCCGPASPIAVDSAGNIHLTGQFQGTASFGNTTLTSKGALDVFVAKLDSAGQVLWATSAGGPAQDFVFAVAVDSAGNSHITGHFFWEAYFDKTKLTSNGLCDVYVARLDSAGNWLWATPAGSPDCEAIASGIAVDSAGNSFVTGNFQGTTSFGNTKLTSNGSLDVFAAKLSSKGKVQWATSAGGPSYDAGYAIAADGAGNSHITGEFYGTASFGTTTLTSKGSGDVFVARLDSTGQVAWAASAGGLDLDKGYALAVDSAGSTHVTGHLQGTASFGTTTLTAQGLLDVFVAKLDSTGQVLWATSAGGAAGDVGFGIAVDSAGNAYLTGSFQGTAGFGATTLTSQGSSDVFVWRPQ